MKWHFAPFLQLTMTESLRSWTKPNYYLLSTSEGSHLFVHREKVSHSKTYETHLYSTHILFFPLQWLLSLFTECVKQGPVAYIYRADFGGTQCLLLKIDYDPASISRRLKAFLPTPAEQRGSCTEHHLTQGVSSGSRASERKRGFLWQLHSTSTSFSMTFPGQKCRTVAIFNLVLKVAHLSSVI